MTTAELALDIVAHRRYLRCLYETGRINEWMHAEPDGHPAPDEIARRRRRRRLALLGGPVNARAAGDGMPAW